MFGKSQKKLLQLRWGIAALAITAAGSMLPASVSAQVSGAIYTTDAACDGTDLNIYPSKSAVYVNGGPKHQGAAALPDGEYYIQVTAPDGTLLGTSLGMADPTPATVLNGSFTSCPQLSTVLKKASDGTVGYDDTPNTGGEYKVWVSQDSAFNNSLSKTDNFKVKSDGGGGSSSSGTATLVVQKFYDANASGTKDGTETFITGWQVKVSGCTSQDPAFTEFVAIVDPTVDCVVTEYMPTQTNWMRTTPAGTDTITLTVPAEGTGTAVFGNLCLGAGGGHTLGFWSNKNGMALVSAADLQALAALNLRNADGSAFDPASYADFRTWVLGAKATNMAYMLSAQLAAMELGVYEGNVNALAMIYAPGTTSANALGFATVADVMDEANTDLGLHGLTLSGSDFRAHQEALKNALDDANNNLNFVQGSACAFTF